MPATIACKDKDQSRMQGQGLKLRALMQVPKLESDYGEDAARFLSQAAGSGQRMTARIERKEKQQPQPGRGRDPLASQPLLHVILFKEGSDAVAESVNADLLRAGLARVKVPKNAKVSAVDMDLTVNQQSGLVHCGMPSAAEVAEGACMLTFSWWDWLDRANTVVTIAAYVVQRMT